MMRAAICGRDRTHIGNTRVMYCGLKFDACKSLRERDGVRVFMPLRDVIIEKPGEKP